MNSERFRFFPSVHRESDLLIGVPHRDFAQEMQGMVLQEQSRLYELISSYAGSHPTFLTSLDPLPMPDEEIPDEISTMIRCGIRTGTGPMSSVAGLFAGAAGRLLAEKYNPGEVVVENGGDLYVSCSSDLLTGVHTGKSDLSGKLGLVIPPGSWGVCTSSGTLGHSFSLGKADAVTVAAENPARADAWATALANRIRDPGNVEQVLEEALAIPEIRAIVVIAFDKIGIRGDFMVKPLS
jgi:ApbE superfamily uncharacterized protein (UPF0280 family)